MFRILLVSLIMTSVAHADNWPNWRGPTNDGHAPGGNPPITWSETENIKWKTAIPGEGNSTPVVWGNRVFVTTAIMQGEPSTTTEADLETATREALAQVERDRGLANVEIVAKVSDNRAHLRITAHDVETRSYLAINAEVTP